MATESRGLRDSNPGNIVRGTVQWQGMAADQSSDPRFVVFTAPVWGLRALAKTLLTYYNQYGLKTVQAIISRWAPNNENDTEAYVAAVSEGVGVGPNDVINVDSADTMRALVKAIVLHENGSCPYSDTMINEAMHMAGVADAPPKPLVKQTSFVTKATGGAAVALGAAGSYAPTVKDWAQQLADFSGAPMVAHAIEIITTVGGILVLASIVADVLKQRSGK